tara:strand:+ start:798 stop:1418 length:621 start_codon:yes stop_codon:yes gene_type:complete
MNLQEVFKKIEMALTPSEEATPEVQEEVKVEMANMRLANGVLLEAESFEAGQNVFLVGEDEEKVAAPVGEHKLEDGRVMLVEEEGVIAEIREAVAEAESEEEVEVEQSAEEEAPVQEEMADEEDKMNYVTKEEFESAIGEIKEMIAGMKPQEEMSAEESTEVEMSVDQAPAAKKVAAAPVEKKVEMNRYAKKAPQDTFSRVLSKLS